MCRIVEVSDTTASQNAMKVSASTPRKSSKHVTVPHNADTGGKPPNILVFSESSCSVESIKAALTATLEKYR